MLLTGAPGVRSCDRSVAGIDDGHRADTVLVQHLAHVLDAVVRFRGYHGFGHQVVDLHIHRASLRDWYD